MTDLYAKEQPIVKDMKNILDQFRKKNEIEKEQKNNKTGISSQKSAKDEKEAIIKLKSLGYIK